jgi:DNA-binding NarL/FixJ family response regulator
MRVVVAEDSPLLRKGIVRVLQDAEIEVVGEAGDADELLRKVRAHKPDLAIVDIRMPPRGEDDGLVAAETLRGEMPELAVLVLSQYVEEHYAQRLLASGAEGAGYLLKDRVADPDRFVESVKRVANGGSVLDPEVVAQMLGRKGSDGPVANLTERETEVLQRMAEGRTNRAISQELFLSERAVERHITGIFDKLGLTNTGDDHRRVLAVLAWMDR